MRYSLLFCLLSMVLLPLGSVGAQGKPCPDAALSPNVPHAVKSRGKPQQSDFDCFSWQSFVALNWPAGKNRGEPDTAKKFGERGKDDPVVWETYKDPVDVFLPGGKDPCSCAPSDDNCLKACWNKNPIAAQCPARDGPPGNPLRRASLSKEALSKTQALPTAAWLTDQNRYPVSYEILMNRDQFDYIIKNKLYDAAVQRVPPWSRKDIDLPAGTAGAQAPVVGAIEIKAAWKILTGKDDKREFFSRRVQIVDSKINRKTGQPDDKNGEYMICSGDGSGPCCVRELGLVGFHIAHKVDPYRQWVWSTFEHVRNVPIQGEKVDPKARYNFYDPNCKSGPACQANSQGEDAKTPNQITRVLPKDNNDRKLIMPKDVNTQWRALVKGTVWENYMLVGTQWPTRPAFAEGTPQPKFLANTTMESYIQPESSCMACHAAAKTKMGKSADYSYLFQRAGMK